ncbi:protein kinase domain-containing protein [Amycolatopsis taiwanensis]|uniref:protein kinase domain-containing protein n=1 Tax=Amycolatopsis taiwanensis TaxID=342230 RepID=UPI0004B56C10|nr:protein kinase [Amycolatopsis taiwanensis]
MTQQGELVGGRYRLVSRVGRGAMGVVWRAHDERLDRVVAVKQLVVAETADETTADEAARRVMREARLAARLQHPHAVTVYDVVSDGGRPYLVMEFVSAESLSALAGRSGGLTSGQVAKLGAQVAAALAAAHAEGIIHRDVTPGNVLITPDGTAKLADFGISRAAGEATLTASGFVVGTPAYLAPEVASGAEADFPSDVFSLGATLYFAVEGAPPFGTDANPIALLHRIARDEIPPPRHPGPLADVLLCLLRRDPAERPELPAVAEALAAVADGRPVPDLPPPASPRSSPPSSRSSPPSSGFGSLSSRFGSLSSGFGSPSSRFGSPSSRFGSSSSGFGQEPGERAPASGTKALPLRGTKVLPPQGDWPEEGSAFTVFRRLTARRLAVAGLAVALVAGGVLLGTIFSNDGQPNGVAAGQPPASTAALPPPSASSSAPPHGSCHAEYHVTGSWPGGYQAQVTVRNDGTDNLTGWSVSWTVPSGNILQVWNGTLSQQGSSITVTNADFNAVLHAGSSTSFGLNATDDGSAAPADITPTCQES